MTDIGASFYLETIDEFQILEGYFISYTAMEWKMKAEIER